VERVRQKSSGRRERGVAAEMRAERQEIQRYLREARRVFRVDTPERGGWQRCVPFFFFSQIGQPAGVREVRVQCAPLARLVVAE